MKLLPKIVVAVVVAGTGATMYAAPGGWLSPGDTGGSAEGGDVLSLEEMLSRTQTIKTQMLADFQHVLHLQSVARKDKDIIKLNCVNDKLVILKPQMNLGDDALNALQSAQDPAEQHQAFDAVGQAGDQVRALREAADQCAGQGALITGSSNEYTHPKIVESPEDSPFSSTIEAPAYASPIN